MRVASVHTYPIKGCYRVDAAEADVEPWGLLGDRRWFIADAGTGVAVTQRDAPALTRIRPIPVPGGLVLRTTGKDDLDVPAPAGGAGVEVVAARVRFKAVRAGAGADAWLSAALGRDVFLAYLEDPAWGGRGSSRVG